MRFVLIVVALVASCGRAGAPPADPSRPAWYAGTTRDLATLDRQAEAAFASGQPDQAAALIEKGQPMEKKLFSVTHPTLEAGEAASDLDDLYGRMLLKNRHYGWARLMFQKNLSRWKHWSPESAETIARYKKAAEEIDQCDREMSK